jgi:nucleotide-binding universal stress UspA family protein
MIPKIKRILYATDLSPNSVYALRYALNMAMTQDADIIILHVCEDVGPAGRTIRNLNIDEKRHQQLFEEYKVQARDLVHNRLGVLRDQELAEQPELANKAVSIEICEGFPAEVILSKADEFNCGAIVMGTHGKGLIRHAFLGSTAKRVLRRARKPVFIIPLPKEYNDIIFEAA